MCVLLVSNCLSYLIVKVQKNFKRMRGPVFNQNPQKSSSEYVLPSALLSKEGLSFWSEYTPQTQEMNPSTDNHYLFVNIISAYIILKSTLGTFPCIACVLLKACLYVHICIAVIAEPENIFESVSFNYRITAVLANPAVG